MTKIVEVTCQPDGKLKDANDRREDDTFLDEVDEKVAEVSETSTDESKQIITYRRVADVQAHPIRWLWPGRIARGKVSIIAGNPGLGKSQLVLSLAAIVTSAGQWPVTREFCERGNVVILSAEDDVADTIRPRLEASGADVKRVFTLDAVPEITQDGETIDRSFNLRTDLDRLGSTLDQIGEVSLIVIDPISAYLGHTDSHNNADMRALLAPLGDLASRHGAAVVCVSHFNKGGGAEAILRITGSMAFVAAARASYVVVKDNEDPERRLFLPIKNNLAKDTEGAAFRVEGRVLSGHIETSCITWEPDAVTIQANDAMAADSDFGSALQDAKEFLEDLLANGALAQKEVLKRAGIDGFTQATVRRAKKALGIKSAKTRFSGGWSWELPTKVLNNAEDAHPQNVSTLGEIDHLGHDSEADATDDEEVF